CPARHRHRPPGPGDGGVDRRGRRVHHDDAGGRLTGRRQPSKATDAAESIPATRSRTTTPMRAGPGRNRRVNEYPPCWLAAATVCSRGTRTRLAVRLAGELRPG